MKTANRQRATVRLLPVSLVLIVLLPATSCRPPLRAAEKYKQTFTVMYDKPFHCLLEIVSERSSGEPVFAIASFDYSSRGITREGALKSPDLKVEIDGKRLAFSELFGSIVCITPNGTETLNLSSDPTEREVIQRTQQFLDDLNTKEAEATDGNSDLTVEQRAPTS